MGRHISGENDDEACVHDRELAWVATRVFGVGGIERVRLGSRFGDEFGADLTGDLQKDLDAMTEATAGTKVNIVVATGGRVGRGDENLSALMRWSARPKQPDRLTLIGLFPYWEVIMDTVSLIGIDLGKHCFHLHAQAASGHMVFRKKLTRNQLFALLGNVPSCTVVMEACAGAHWMACRIQGLGHQAKRAYPIFCV